jgi:hypothetical protein
MSLSWNRRRWSTIDARSSVHAATIFPQSTTSHLHSPIEPSTTRRLSTCSGSVQCVPAHHVTRAHVTKAHVRGPTAAAVHGKAPAMFAMVPEDVEEDTNGRQRTQTRGDMAPVMCSPEPLPCNDHSVMGLQRTMVAFEPSPPVTNVASGMSKRLSVADGKPHHQSTGSTDSAIGSLPRTSPVSNASSLTRSSRNGQASDLTPSNVSALLEASDNLSSVSQPQVHLPTLMSVEDEDRRDPPHRDSVDALLLYFYTADPTPLYNLLQQHLISRDNDMATFACSIVQNVVYLGTSGDGELYDVLAQWLWTNARQDNLTLARAWNWAYVPANFVRAWLRVSQACTNLDRLQMVLRWASPCPPSSTLDPKRPYKSTSCPLAKFEGLLEEINIGMISRNELLAVLQMNLPDGDRTIGEAAAAKFDDALTAAVIRRAFAAYAATTNASMTSSSSDGVNTSRATSCASSLKSGQTKGHRRSRWTSLVRKLFRRK